MTENGTAPSTTYLTPEEVWRRYDAVESRVTAPVSERMLDMAGINAGMRILDLATGRGEPALRAARRVGPTGRVLGIDPAEALLGMARAKAELDGLANIELRSTNAESLEGVPLRSFHAVTCRWGLMYMDAPVTALSHARRALLADGVLVAALWAEPERVPYFTLPRRLLERHRAVPPIDPEAPGTFRYAGLHRIHRDFAEAGFTIDAIEEMDIPVFETERGEELLAWVRALGLAQLLDGLPEDVQRAWELELLREAERGRTDGVLRLGGVTRIVRARTNC